MAVEWPMEFHLQRQEDRQTVRTVTQDISTGGLYFELDLLEGIAEPRPQDVLHLVLTVPPGEGYSPYEGQVSSVGRIVRRSQLDDAAAQGIDGTPESYRRLGIGVEFQKPLKLAF